MTDPQPVLRTARLVLRPFRPDDAPAVRHLAGAPEVADTTLNIPHPYPEGMAEAWIGTHQPGYEKGEMAVFAITDLEGGLVGAIGLHLNAVHRRAEMGYWVGLPFWNRGYATEAAKALIEYGFTTLGLNRINAHHFVRNPASGTVMQKVGMQREGRLRQHMVKNNTFEDLEMCAILRSEWSGARA